MDMAEITISAISCYKASQCNLTLFRLGGILYQ